MRRNSPTRLTRLTTALLASLALLVATPGAAAGVAGFGDVEDDKFYTDAVAWMVGQNITTGLEIGCFGPYDHVSRGQIATFLYRLDAALGNDPQGSTIPSTT